MKRLATFTGILMIVSLTLAAPVLAAPPSNDMYDGRLPIAVGDDLTVDTTEATTDADDEEMNIPCGAPAMDASVWYEFTASADGFIAIDVSESNYSAGVFVALGSPGSFEVLGCGPGATFFEAVAGETYAILAIDDQSDGAGNGGTLRITMEEIPPPPDVSVTLNRTGRFNHDGSATISGTVTCSDAPVEFTFIDIFVQQAVGRIKINGFGFIEGFTCDGTTQAWSADVFADNGIFKGGKALSVSFAIACGEFLCGEGFDERVVQLKGKKN